MPRLEDSGVAFMRHLRERGFTRAPELFGSAIVTDHDRVAWVLATEQRFIAHPSDLEVLLRDILRAGTADERMIRTAENVADALAELHRALAEPGSDPTFGVHPLVDADVGAWRADAFDDLQSLLDAGIQGVIAVRDAIEETFASLPAHVDAATSRAHGRLTLHRVLLVEGIPVFVGFGETLADRSSPLKDVASLARSFDAVTREAIAASAHDPTADHGETSATMRDVTARALKAFVSRYGSSAADLPTVPRDPAQREGIIRFFRVRMAVRDVCDALTRHPGALAAAVDALRAEVRHTP